LLYAAHLTSRLFEPAEQFELLKEGIGVTNAAYRTTPGSGDLRRGDFDRARLERIAEELRPEWLAFVGKEAYRGLFGERAALGVQERRLGETRLFVLPSTSPANAAVPWFDRARWFLELSARVWDMPVRDAVRALVIDPTGRVMLVRADDDLGVWWTTPGGGIERGETDHEALARELVEELGLRDFELGPLIWRREHRLVNPRRWSKQTERHYLVRTGSFEPAPVLGVEALAEEGAMDAGWFTVDEVRGMITGPRRLADLVEHLLRDGPPPVPIDAGV
jgi:8-oxo-dGTP pyrophosphatase MutT (NUDIX family)/G:T/U-mismatch repair DNA glycosylase